MRLMDAVSRLDSQTSDTETAIRSMLLSVSNLRHSNTTRSSILSLPMTFFLHLRRLKLLQA